MVLGQTGYNLTHGRDGSWWYDFGKGWKQADPACSDACQEILKVYRSTQFSDMDRETALRTNKPKIFELGQPAPESLTESITDAAREKVASNLINFFSEFHFEPNFRFTNTLFNIVRKQGNTKACEYIFNYFSLTDSVYKDSLKEKMTSVEFSDLLDSIYNLGDPRTTINTRFKLYFGAPGTGKTVKAIKEAEDVMVCHSAVLPQDLMEDFDFDNGNATFKPSALQRAIVEGKKICLDEINLLPYDSLRFLQSILDGKSSFIYKGKEIKIADGFKIIGTMNLVVNGCVYSLPDPLVDRAEELEEFKLSAKNLVGAF